MRWRSLRDRFAARDLCTLATWHGTDKWNTHWYAQHYDRHFRDFRQKPVKLLEIGVGGYDDPLDGGQSLRMWKSYFPRGQITGIDLHDKSKLVEPRIRVFQGSQADAEFLHRVAETAGPFDIVIDDGSHVNEHVLASFEVLFPRLAEGGLYAIEDAQTSYWPGKHGGCTDLASTFTTMGRMKQCVDGLNYEEFLDPAYESSYYDRNIVGMHFYHNLVIINKGRNCEGSNKARLAHGPCVTASIERAAVAG